MRDWKNDFYGEEAQETACVKCRYFGCNMPKKADVVFTGTPLQCEKFMRQRMNDLEELEVERGYFGEISFLGGKEWLDKVLCRVTYEIGDVIEEDIWSTTPT